MSESAAAGLPPGVLIRTLEGLTAGVAVFDEQWRVRYINPAGADLLKRPATELLGRVLWTAIPEMTDTIFHGLLLRARSLGERVTWDGFYAPTGQWWTATAEPLGHDLQVSFHDISREAGSQQAKDGADEHTQTGDRMRFLAEVTDSMIVCPLDVTARITMLAELAVRRLADWALVVLADTENGIGQQVAAHRNPDLQPVLDTYLHGLVPDASDMRLMQVALLSGEPVHIRRIDRERERAALPNEKIREAWQQVNSTSMTVVPLRARGATFGALALINTGDRPPHTEEQIAEAVDVARRGALAINAAQLFEAQFRVAEALQRSLLTPPPQVEGVEIAVRYQPATSNMHIGGDWYDAFYQSEHDTLFVIGDVVGHDVNAAATMGQVRNILRGIACERPHSPAEVLTRVDRALNRLDIRALATTLVALLEAPPDAQASRSRILHWSSAGHLPPLLHRADGTVTVLSTTAERLLGTSGGNPSRTDHSTILNPGDAVILYTDGIIEHGRTLIDDGIDRLRQVLTDYGPAPADAIADHLLHQVLRGRIDDDSAILVLRLLPESADPADPSVPVRLALSESITASPRIPVGSQGATPRGIDRRLGSHGRRAADRPTGQAATSASGPAPAAEPEPQPPGNA